MSRDNLYDTVVEGVFQRMESASDVIAKNFKGVKPFGKKEISKKELFEAYDQLGTLDMEYLVQKHGREKVNSLIADMERQRNG